MEIGHPTVTNPPSCDSSDSDWDNSYEAISVGHTVFKKCGCCEFDMSLPSLILNNMHCVIAIAERASYNPTYEDVVERCFTNIAHSFTRDTTFNV